MLAIGVAFTMAGILSYLSTIAASRLASQVVEADIPIELQAKLVQFVSDSTFPLQMYGIGFLIAGIGLIICSLLLKSRNADDLL